MYLTNEEYVARLGTLYDRIMSIRKDSDYIINPPQMDKLVNILSFFMDAVKKIGGKVEPVRLVPREEHGGVTAEFIVFDIYGDDVKRFCDAMQHASAIGIDAKTDGTVCIAVTVPNVFVHR